MSKRAKILLVVSGLFSLSVGLSNIFVNIFLWKNSKDLTVVAGYNLCQYVFIPITFIFAGGISKRKNGVWALRIGVVLFALFFLSILIIKDNAVKYAYPLGMLFGTALGFYWLAYYVLSFDFTSVNNRDTYNGFDGSIIGIASAIAPLTASYIIHKSTSGYSIVFAMSLGLFIVLTIISLLLRSENYGKSLELSKAFGDNSHEWVELRKGIAAWGMRDVVIIFLIIILIFKTTGSEWMVGKLSLYAYLISAGSFILVQAVIKPKRRRFSIHLGAVLMFTAVWGLVIKVSLPTLLLYITLDAAFMPFFIVPLTSASFNIIEQGHEQDMRVEYIINKEIALNSGRIFVTSLLIGLLALVKNDRVFNYFLILIGSAQLISLYFLRKLKIWES